MAVSDKVTATIQSQNFVTKATTAPGAVSWRSAQKEPIIAPFLKRRNLSLREVDGPVHVTRWPSHRLSPGLSSSRVFPTAFHSVP